MIKSIKSQISKLLMVIMCTSLMPTTIVFAEGDNTQETGTNVVQTTGSGVSVSNSSSTVETTVSAVTATTSSDFSFDSSTGTITGYNGSDSDVVIPSEINGVKVISIGADAFGFCGITSITLPNGVTSIGNDAFCWCGSLTSVKIPDSVISIGDRAFVNCGLTSITLPNSITNIGESAFAMCTSLRSITIPNSVTSIGGGAFAYCTKLTSITIPNSVTSIGNSAFENCYINAKFYVDSKEIKQLLIDSGVDNNKIILSSPSLVTNITLNNTRLNLEKGTTSTLTATVLPDNATNKEVKWSSSNTNVATVDENGNVTGVVAGSTIITCTASDGSGQSLTCLVTVTNKNATVTDTSEFEFDSSTGTITKYIGSDTEVIIPSEINGIKVISIGDGAFMGTYINTVSIPNSVTSIGNMAFSECSLSSISIPSSVTSIGNEAFEYCENLTNITIPNGVTSIGNYVFFYCGSLISITMPDSITSIGDNSYYIYRGNGCYAMYYVKNGTVKQLLLNSGVDESEIILDGQSSTVSVTNVTLNNTSLNLKTGNTSTLTATVLPDNATNKEVIWKSNNTNVATIDGNGKVTAVGAGSATITCTASDGSGQSSRCLVTVTNPAVKVTSIKLSIKNGGDQIFTLVPTVSPSNATIKDVTWRSSNTKVATVDSNGNVTYVGKGEATITCTTTDGSNVSKSFYVKNDYYTSQTK